MSNETTLRALLYIADTLKCEVENGRDENIKKLENEFGKNNTVISQLYEFALMAINYDLKTQKILRLRAGSILSELVKNINNVINLSETRKFFIYSTHDAVIVSLMKALGVYNDRPPNYGEGLVFELYHDKSITEYQLKISYIYHDKDYETTFHHLKLPKCISHLFCTFNEFNSSISEFIPNNWNKECQN